MIRWRDFDYLITSAPKECPFDIEHSTTKVAMSPRGQWIIMTEADALLIVMDDAQGLKPTACSDLFEFTGNRPNFDHWMSAHHPDIGYLWLDQFAVGFPDQAAQLSFDDDLGERVLRAKHFPRTVSTVKKPSPHR